MRNVSYTALLLVAGTSIATAQSGETSGAQRAIPQEEAMWSCTSQVESQSLETERQKNQWLMACLTGNAGSGPASRAAPREQHATVCRQQATYLNLQGGESENFVNACIQRNDDLIAKSGGQD